MSDAEAPGSGGLVPAADRGDGTDAAPLPDLRYGGSITGQATARMALIAIALVFFIGVAIGYLLGRGA